MTQFDKMIEDINSDNMMSNHIYWFGTDTQGRSKYCAFEENWEEVYDTLLNKNIINDDRLYEEYYNEDTESLELPVDFDYKEFVLSCDGNAYYQYYVETDDKGEIIDEGGDINWFPITEREKKNKKYEYIARFNRDNYRHYHIKVNLKDKDVIDKLDSVSSKNGYITELIRKDIRK